VALRNMQFFTGAALFVSVVFRRVREEPRHACDMICQGLRVVRSAAAGRRGAAEFQLSGTEGLGRPNR